MVILVIILIPMLIAVMTELIIATESGQKRNINLVKDRYEHFSSLEIAGYSLINNINGIYLEELNTDSLESSCKLDVSAFTGNDVKLEVVNSIETEGKIQLNIKLDNKEIVIILSDISLIEEQDTEDKEIYHYLIDCSNCVIRRAVSYV